MIKILSKKFIIVLILCSILFGVLVFHLTRYPNYPKLEDGDLIFQISTSNQAGAIILATGSLYSHMGIIKNDSNQTYVIEATSTVRKTSLKQWINRGLFNRIAIYRHKEMYLQKSIEILTNVKKYYGKSYDIFFSFQNDALYCSELPYIAYQQSGFAIGTVQTVSELNFDNILVRKLIQKRWKRHPQCQDPKYKFETCYTQIMRQKLITPVSLARDPKMKQIYSNFWL